MRWQPDPTFYPSPRMAMEAPAEKLAYVARLVCVEDCQEPMAQPPPE